MHKAIEQSTTYKLDKAHFQECFEQSASPVTRKDYLRAAVLGGLGVALFFVEAEHYYIPFFIFCLGVLELLSIKYRKTWWVWRQLMGKSGNQNVELTIDQKGILIKSKHVNNQINWSSITELKKTPKGLILHHQGGANYLSNSHLSPEIQSFIDKHYQAAVINQTSG